ncbi:beta-phosphoglucomutase [uncultured Acetobacteroides sp.]|uniref:beta-phosphoglucomutase n=1 Tax=uncultured Acetobacteroides sp. TaxID=1760811 RepID=UPI0029F52046|nr:beta-phosphoglucomutase [uncultured Acetobacteroides sp.]
MREIKACIFDLDGVIVDTAKYHYLAWKRLAEMLGFEFTQKDNERLKGVSRVRSLEILLEVGGVTATPEQKEVWAHDKNEWYVDYITKMGADEILPGVVSFLAELRQHGVKTAIGSASKNANLILTRLGLMDNFDVIIDGNKVSSAKPDPEVFFAAVTALGVSPEHSVVFEDAEAGIEAAKAGGMFAIGIGSEQVLAKADVVIGGLSDLNYEKFMCLLNK